MHFWFVFSDTLLLHKPVNLNFKIRQQSWLPIIALQHEETKKWVFQQWRRVHTSSSTVSKCGLKAPRCCFLFEPFLSFSFQGRSAKTYRLWQKNFLYWIFITNQSWHKRTGSLQLVSFAGQRTPPRCYGKFASRWFQWFCIPLLFQRPIWYDSIWHRVCWITCSTVGHRGLLRAVL